MRGVGLVVLVLAAGCFTGGGHEAGGDSARAPGGHAGSGDLAASGWLGAANYTQETNVTETDWQSFALSATPGGSLAVYRLRVAPDTSAIGRYGLIFNVGPEHENLTEFGAITFVLGETVDVTAVEVRGRFQEADAVESDALARPWVVPLESFVRVDMQHSDGGELALLLFARATEPVVLEGAFSMWRSESELSWTSFQEAANQGQLHRMELAGEGGAFDWGFAEIWRPDGACLAPYAGLLRWHGPVTVESVGLTQACGVAQQVDINSSLDGWSMLVSQSWLLPSQRTFGLNGQGDARSLTSAVVPGPSGPRQTHPEDPMRRGETIYLSAAGSGGLRAVINDEASAWTTHWGRAVFFTTDAPVAEWLGKPMATCLNIGLYQEESIRRSFCQAPPDRSWFRPF